jgi:hypothetical protein
VTNSKSYSCVDSVECRETSVVVVCSVKNLRRVVRSVVVRIVDASVVVVVLGSVGVGVVDLISIRFRR